MSAEAPPDADLYRCVHCGLCLNACPTYLETGLETESPRGRIFFMRAVRERRLPLTNAIAGHWGMCLQCRACEAACPSGVPFGRLMAAMRHEALVQRPPGLRERLLRWLALHCLLPHPRRLRVVGRLLRLYQRSGVRQALRTLGLLRLLRLADVDAQLPPLPPRDFLASGQTYPARPEPAGGTGSVEGLHRPVRVALFSGCVMPIFYGPVHEATVRVLARNGCEVVVPEAQLCCGALHVHSGEHQAARELARRNIAAFEAAGADYVVVNAAGCGAQLKEYAGLFGCDPAWRARAERFSASVRDVTELLASLPFERGLGKLSLKVTYQDPCHLAHAQRIKDAPRRLLRAVPGLTLMETERPDLCCGAAGSYNLVERAMSQRLLERKMREIAATGADVIATANPGCQLQLQAGVRRHGLRMRVAHVLEVLDEAYRASAD
ncbi:MAG: 4Fe-4S dicluster domain-containing protein [Chloroflexi bacterium]|nr:4Fe-4S dicluster domain-containing protein [Chloroflexota bacterium]